MRRTRRRRPTPRLLATVLLLASAMTLEAQAPPAIRSDADLESLLPRLSNWGRWGPNDELGTLNYLTPERVRAAGSLVREGITVSLARSVTLLDNAGIRRGQYEMQKDESGSRDYLAAVWHGFSQTHLDALCHAFARPETMYNGIPTSEVQPAGCRRLGVDVIARRGVVGRGVLLDIAGLRDAPLDPGTPILARDLDEALRRQKLELRPGSVLLVRTGAGVRNTREKRAGLHPECLPWVRDHQVALLIGDGDNDVAPLPGFERFASAFHSVGIPHLGLPLVDNADLDALARECRNRGRWEFLLVIAPWGMKGATSSPVNPIAVF